MTRGDAGPLVAGCLVVVGLVAGTSACTGGGAVPLFAGTAGAQPVAAPAPPAPPPIGRGEPVVDLTARWQGDVGPGANGGALVVGGTIVSGSDCLVAYRADTGARRWVFADTRHPVVLGMTQDAGLLVAMLGTYVRHGEADSSVRPGRLVVLDPSSGRLRWSRTIGGGPVEWYPASGLPVTSGDVVVAEEASGRLVGYRLRDGRRLWSTEGVPPAPTRQEPPDWFDDQCLAGVFGPSIAGGGVVVVGSCDGGVVGIDPATGRLLWRRTYGDTGVRTVVEEVPSDIGPLVVVSASPGCACAPSAVHFGYAQNEAPSPLETLVVVDASDGRALWQLDDVNAQDESPENDTVEYAQVVGEDGSLCVGIDLAIECRAASDGALEWTRNTIWVQDDQLTSFLAGDTLYLTVPCGRETVAWHKRPVWTLEALDPESGAIRGTALLPPPGRVGTLGPARSGLYPVVVAAGSGVLVVESTMGPPSWTFSSASAAASAWAAAGVGTGQPRSGRAGATTAPG